MSWEQADVPVSVSLTGVYFPTPEKGWAVGQDGVVLHTADGGKRWIEQFNGEKGLAANIVHAETLVKEKEAELVEAPAQDQPGIEADLDNFRMMMENFVDAANEKYCCSPLLDVWFKNETEGFVIGAYGSFYHTEDGGSTWTPWWDHIDNPDSLHLNGISKANNAIFIVGEAGSLFRSFDGGNNFEAVFSPYEGTFFGLVCSPNKNWVVAFGLKGNYVCSEDLGETWTHNLAIASGTLSGATINADGKVTIVSYSGNALTGIYGEFITQKIGGYLIGVTEASDGQLVVVGLGGVKRIGNTDSGSGGN
jgi:photosystem II stability/assembly factor-like uncharacterized protein